MDAREYKILLVEDEFADYHLFKEYLESNLICKYHIDWINSYLEAEKSIIEKKMHYDALIIDYYLGPKTGMDLLNLLKKEKIPVPVILLTGNDNSKVDMEAMQNGASDFLVKSQINTELLDRSIRYSIERYKNELLILRQQRNLVALMQMAAHGEESNEIMHEINNPLTVIQTLVETMQLLLQKNKLGEDFIKESLLKMKNMLNRIFDLKRKIKDRINHRKRNDHQRVLLNKLISEALRLCEDKISKYKIQIRLDLQDNLFVSVHPIELSQVFINLIVNSCEAIGDFETKWIELKAQKSDLEILKITITDSGSGISSENKEKIFSRYHTTKQYGTGLGLNLSRKIIESYGGSLTLDENSEHTKFEIRIPCNTENTITEPYRILIVEDNDGFSGLIHEELTKMGYHAMIETTVTGAYDIISSTNFDAVISDIYLNDGSGIDLIKHIRESLGENVVLVLMSGYINNALSETIKKISIDFVMEKPFDLNKMISLVVESITKKKSKKVAL